jgi:hypothetical protein
VLPRVKAECRSPGSHLVEKVGEVTRFREPREISSYRRADFPLTGHAAPLERDREPCPLDEPRPCVRLTSGILVAYPLE